MDEEVESTSWLSGLLEQTDRLVLAIGGYDSSEVDYNFQDFENAEFEDEEGDTDDDLEDKHPAVEMVEKGSPKGNFIIQQAISFEDSEEDSDEESESDGDQEDNRLAEVEANTELKMSDKDRGGQAQGIAQESEQLHEGAQLTASAAFPKQEVLAPLSTKEVDTPASDETPRRNPPDIVNSTSALETGFGGISEGSSRVAPLELELQHEVVEDFKWSIAVGPKTATPSVLRGDYAVNRRNNSAGSSLPTKIVDRVSGVRGGAGRKSRRFSFMADTAWMKPKLESPVMASPSPSALDPSSSTSFASPTTANELREHDSENPYDAERKQALSTPPQNTEVLTDMGRQLQRYMTTTAYPEAETGADESERSDLALEQRPEDDGISPGSLADPLAESRNDSRDDTILEENGASVSGEVNVEEYDSSTPTIGSKRDSAGNGIALEDLMNFSSVVAEPDNDFVATPSKRGKTEPVNYRLGVMRHSSRLDDAINERQRHLSAAKTASGGCESRDNQGNTASLQNGANDNDLIKQVPWSDRALRPFDTPIVDKELPALQAMELGQIGFGEETLIVCSPFRRCLQTAGVVARTLGVEGVTVNLEVGERMDKVRKEIAERTISSKIEESNGQYGGISKIPVFTYLDRAGMMEALGEGVHLDEVIGDHPPNDESGVEAKQRFIATIGKLRQNQLQETSVLIVAHGDTLDAAGESLASQIIYEADYCAWTVFDLDKDFGYVAESYGVQMIPL